MLENISKGLKKVVLVGGVAGVVYSVCLGFNHLTQDTEHINGYYHSISRADGALQKTELTVTNNEYYKEDEVYQYKAFGSSLFITDGGMYGKNDGLVDMIHIPISMFSGFSGVLTREKDYKRFKSEFDNADKILAETKERFKKYLPNQ